MNRFTPLWLLLVLIVAPFRGSAQVEQADPLILAGRFDEALAIYAKAIESDPKSVRLHLQRFDLLEKAGRSLEARPDVEVAFSLDGSNVDVLKRYARTMDVFGNHAGVAYFQLATALRLAKAPAAEITQALDRGLVVALRDGETASADSIETELSRLDGRPALSRLSPEDTAEGHVLVPGGIRALALATAMKSDVSPALFALQYCQRIANTPGGLAYGIHLYFQTMESLKRHGALTPGGLDILLDLRDPSNARNVQEVMRLMGWRVTLTEDPVLHGVFHLAIDLGTEKDDAFRQAFSSGFGIDFFAVKDALENVHMFKLHIPYETIPIVLSEKFWLDQVIGGKQKRFDGFLQIVVPATPPNLFLSLADHVPASRLYVALASVNSRTRQLLLQNLSADRLASQYSNLLAQYGASISANGGQLEVPGGPQGVQAWQQLAGASPDHPGAFINALMQKDGGKLLAYFHTLLQLPLENQRFFTRTPERLAAFYNVFPFSALQVQEQNVVRRDTHFFDLARELPLDEQGRVAFPGGENVWRSGQPSGTDQTLLGLLGRTFQIGASEHYESESFLEIVHLQKTWRRPIDSASVVLLDRNYAKYHALYPYLFSLPPLNAAELGTFFKAADGVDQLLRIDRGKLDNVLGEFHGIVSLLAILHETGGIQEKDTKLILSSFGVELSLITTDVQRVRQLREYTQLALTTLMKIVSAVHSQASVADDRLVEGMAGVSQDIEFRSDDQQWNVNRAAWQSQRIRGVLGAQTVTSIQALLDLYRDALDLLSSQPESANATLFQLARIQRMELKSAELHEVVPRSEDHLSTADRARLIQAKPDEVAQSIAKLKMEAGRGNLKALPALAGQFLEQLTPFVKTALIGWSYAYYASPDDLVVSGDRYFVRRHQFVRGTSDLIWLDTDVQSCGNAAGVCVSGGLAELGVAAGDWGRTKTEVSASLHSEESFDEALKAELTSIRAVPWSQVTTASQHRIGLQIRVGREAIVRAAMATADATRDAMGEHLIGLVGNIRRAAIMRSLSAGNPAAVFDLLSASDLYFLVESMRRDSKDWRLPGPLFDAFDVASSGTPDAIGYLGGSHLRTQGVVNPQIVGLGPCEEYEKLLRKEALWECSGQVLLNIAEAADREGIPADGMAILSEAALRQLGSAVVMTDQEDWLAVVRAMNRISLLEVLPELEKARRN